MSYIKTIRNQFTGNEQRVPNIAKMVAHMILGIIFLTLIFGSFGTVSAGDRGVKTRFSKVVGTIEPGLYFKLPFVEDVNDMDVQTQKEQTDATAASSDLQDVRTTVAVNYNVDPTKVGDLYTNIGDNYSNRIIDPAIQEVVKSVTAKYTAEQLITKRTEVTDAIHSQLSEKLSPYYINVGSVSIVNFDFSASFNQAIEAKVTAEQNALAAKNKLDQVKFEAQQKIETAKADAESIKIQAQAINSQGGADYVALQAIKQWDGHYPTTMLGGNSVPLIQLK